MSEIKVGYMVPHKTKISIKHRVVYRDGIKKAEVSVYVNGGFIGCGYADPNNLIMGTRCLLSDDIGMGFDYDFETEFVNK